jgi:hypothetical protein
LNNLASRAGAPAETVSRTGPCGLSVRVRARVAAGLAGAGGLRPDPSTIAEIRAAFWRAADAAFERLIAHSDAVELFKRGKQARPDRKGFRAVNTSRLRDWLREVLDSVLDRWGLPVPLPRADGKDPDCQLRNWPLWALGDRRLTALRDLQESEYLQHQFRPADSVSPVYSSVPRLSATGPDLFAYRRLRDRVGANAAFVPRAGCRFIRFSLARLPLAALAATLRAGEPQGGRTASHQTDSTGSTQPVEPVASADSPLRFSEELRVLAATGLGVEGVAALSEWRIPACPRTAEIRADYTGLQSRDPDLARYTADRSADQVASSFGTTAQVLQTLVEFDPQTAERGEGFLRQFHRSPRARQLLTMMRDRRDDYLEHWKSNTPSPVPAPVATSFEIGAVRRMLGSLGHALRERVVTPTGRVYLDRDWVPARAAFLESAEDAFTEAVFAVLDAGHSVVALGPFEFVTEVPEATADDSREGVARLASQTAGRALGVGTVSLASESLVHW